METVEAEVTSTTTEATCTESGETVYKATVSADDSLDGTVHTDTKTVTIEALGHDYELSGWNWAEDYSTATATFTCKNDSSHTESVTDDEIDVETVDATATENGSKTYTASVTGPDGNTYTDSKEVVIPATGYTYKDTVYSWTETEDGYTVTALKECNEDEAQNITETVNAEYSVTTEATCEEAGRGVWTATFENEEFETQTKEVTIEALGHDWGEYTLTKAAIISRSGMLTRTCNRSGCDCEDTLVIAPAMAKAQVKTKTSAKITWLKVNGAQRYRVYFAKCGKSLRLVATTTKLSFLKKKLVKGRNYKFRVVAQRKINGKWVNIATSYIGHFVSGNLNSTGKYTNVKAITVTSSNVSIAAGKTSQIKPKMTMVRAGKKVLPKSHAATYRYLTTNSAIATVSTAGKITGVASGTCKVYVVGMNGVRKAITVTVN